MKEKILQLVDSKKFMMVVSMLGLYLLSTGTSWAVFSFIKGEPGGVFGDPRSNISELPKTEECPLNGMYYSVPEREIWEERRPLTVIIENHEDARPLSGLHKADIVYEAVAEGGITRFLSVFYCGASAENVKIAPVRSARIYFVNWATEYGENPIFLHVGGANNSCLECPGGVKTYGTIAKEVNAISELESLGWRYRGGNDFDNHYDINYPVIKRDVELFNQGVAWEHVAYSETDLVFEEAESRDLKFRGPDGNNWDDEFNSWLFQDEKPLESPKASNISFEFWSNKPKYDVEWKYNKSTNSYLRYNNGEELVDSVGGEHFSAKNVVIQFIKERGPVDKELHMFYTTIGEGDALIFHNGDIIEATWEKETQTSRTVFYDEEGDEIEFVRGPIWIEAVPTGNEINY